MKISKTGLNLIKEFEGCRLVAYKCPAGVWTIGIGHTGNVDGKLVGAGMKITQAKAEELLATSLDARYEPSVRKLGDLNQNQYDALVSFCYNLGPGIFKGSLLSAITKQDWDSVAEQMLMYNKARVNGVLTELAGLTRRRKSEVRLLLRPCQDGDLEKAVEKIILNGVNINAASWNNMARITLKNVPALLNKLGGVAKLKTDGIITDTTLWNSGNYNANHIRALLIKYASKC